MARKKSSVSVMAGIKKPDFLTIKKESKKYDRDFKNALYYIHYEIASKKLKAETVKYAKSKGYDHNLLDTMENYYFSVLGKGCMMVNKGSDIPDNWSLYIDKEISRLIEKAKERQIEKEEEKKEEEEKKSRPQPSIQDRIKDQASDVSSKIDKWIDDFISNPSNFNHKDYDVHTHLITNNVKAPQARYVWSFYEGLKEEIETFLNSKDEDIEEAYSTYNKRQIKRLSKFLEEVESATTLIVESSKVKRKTRTKKSQSKEKKVEKLKFKLQDTELGLTSESPTEIIGAKEVWIYNTKTRKLGKYISQDGAGLDVKGTSITGYNETDSVQKTLRKPKEQLTEFKKSKKVALRKFLGNIKAVETKLKPRMNEHTVILKIYK